MQSDFQVDVKNPDGTKCSALSYHAFVAALVKRFPSFGSFATTEGYPMQEVADTFDSMASKLEICHSAMGIHTEAGEVADILKAHAIYGKPLDREALVKELGDVRFWMQEIMNTHLISDHEVMQGNADKLSERYIKVNGAPLTYTDQAAIARVDKKWIIALSMELATKGFFDGPYEHEYEALRKVEENGGYVFNLDAIKPFSVNLEEQKKVPILEPIAALNCNGISGQDHVPYKSIYDLRTKCARCGIPL